MNILLNEIEEKGWEGIDTIMDLMKDNIIKFSEQTNVSPDRMREYINAQLETIINEAWDIQYGKAIAVLYD